MLRVYLARNYTICFWLLYLVPSLLLFPFPIIYWYKHRVLNRSYLELGQKTLHLYQGRWFVLDDDVVYTNAIDHIKIDRTICGYIFGWCSIIITTRSGVFTYSYMDMDAAEKLRAEVIT